LIAVRVTIVEVRLIGILPLVLPLLLRRHLGHTAAATDRPRATRLHLQRRIQRALVADRLHFVRIAVLLDVVGTITALREVVRVRVRIVALYSLGRGSATAIRRLRLEIIAVALAADTVRLCSLTWAGRRTRRRRRGEGTAGGDRLHDVPPREVRRCVRVITSSDNSASSSSAIGR
jgi:hypothetical protein